MGADWRSTGLPSADARDDFTRARRRAAWAQVIARLSGRPGDVDLLLPYDEVVAALGRREIVRAGSADRRRWTPSSARPTGPAASTGTSGRPAAAAGTLRAARRCRPARGVVPAGRPLRVGKLHFVRDGHHRVAVARALDWKVIPAFVTEVRTAVPAAADLTIADLPRKGSQRVFFERVPLPEQLRDAIRLRQPDDYCCSPRGSRPGRFAS